MQLVLIKPNIGRMEHSLYVDEARMEPLQLGILAALTPKHIQVKIYDDRCEEIPYHQPADLVAITVETFTARRAYEIADQYRSKGVKVILGGMHPTLMPQEAAQHADAVFTGDAETLWAVMLEDVENGKLKPLYQAEPGVPQAGVITRRDVFENKGYLPISLLQFSRGCVHGCHFCASSLFFKKQHYTRLVEEVVEEIKGLNKKFLFFVDDNIVANYEAAKELFRALIPLKIKWVSQGGIDMVNDPELMKLMVDSGCLGHVIGFESINPDNLQWMNKGTTGEHFNGYKESLEKLRYYGLQTWAAFTLGHDFDTLDSVQRTLEFALKNKFAFAAFNILMPYPGTQLYATLQAENRLLYDGCWWLHPEYRFNYAAFKPKNMSADALTEACFNARKDFNSPSSIVYRAFDLKTNMRSLYRFGVYAAYNPLFRKEVFKKQGMRFGLSAEERRAQV